MRDGKWETELRLTDPDGWERLVHAVVMPMRDAGGACIGYVLLASDITEQKRAQEELKATHERLKYLLVSTSVAIYTSKTSGNYGATSITENVRELTGYQPRAFIENSSFWIDHVHPEDRERVLNEVPIVFEKGSHVYEYRFLHKDGSYRWMRDELRLTRDEEERPFEIVGYWIDVTDRKRAEEELTTFLR
jgi:PAS domain S-box-containing protein